ncbi:PorV/PorQ family protein [Carboxylicivirga linearis]|uniref:DUF3316 domain-containing protein n=1 Tax=Carboxylicivirga linearis TaxID=1628157 RepID=A0ABS5JP88_9BACT|nr:hypothetical protein [Carboxylicivirga linearis]MBS2096712.1 hypothetical protein [Carboxylicivirga linearis]
MNYRSPTLICILSFVASSLFSQDLLFNGPVNTALADVRTIDHSHWAVFNNAASLSSLKHSGLAASYQARFNIKELSTRAISGFYSGNFGVISGGVLQSGYSKSLLSRYLFSFSRKFGNSTSAFLQYNLITHHIETADESLAFYSAFGLQQKITSEIYMAVLISNMEQSKINYGNIDVDVPSQFLIGLMWTNEQWVKVFTEAEKELNRTPVFKGAVEMAINDFLFLRTGIKGEPVEFTFGSGFNWTRLNIDIAFKYHQLLGVSSIAGISYSFNKRAK